MATDSWIQVAVDGAGKRVRNFLLPAFTLGQDVYQQVIQLAKSDGTLIDDPSRSSVTQPVSGAFFQATQPVSATALPLPTGAATDASLGTIAADIALQAKLTDTQPVSLAALPALAAGAAVIGHVIVDSGTITDSGSVAVTNFPATQPVSAVSLPLPTGAALDSSLTTIAADIAAQARLVDTQPVSIAAPVAVTGAFFQVTQPIAGSVTLSGDALQALITLRSAAGAAALHSKSDKLRRMGLHA